MPEEGSSQFSSDMNGDDDQDLDNSRNTADERTWNTTADSGESEDKKEVSITEQTVIELYSPATNDRVGSGGLADAINEKRPSDYGSNVHDRRASEALTVRTATNQTQQMDTDRVDVSELVNIVHGLEHLFQRKWVCLSITFESKYARQGGFL